MHKLDNILAPRALTSAEVASVISPQLIVSGLAHRAFTHAYVWDEQRREAPTRFAAESVLTAVEEDATASLNQWLGDMAADGDPRFFNKGGLKKSIDGLLNAAGRLFCMAEDAAQLETLIANLEGREPDTMDRLIDLAAR